VNANHSNSSNSVDSIEDMSKEDISIKDENKI